MHDIDPSALRSGPHILRGHLLSSSICAVCARSEVSQPTAGHRGRACATCDVIDAALARRLGHDQVLPLRRRSGSRASLRTVTPVPDDERGAALTGWQRSRLRAMSVVLDDETGERNVFTYPGSVSLQVVRSWSRWTERFPASARTSAGAYVACLTRHDERFRDPMTRVGVDELLAYAGLAGDSGHRSV